MQSAREAARRSQCISQLKQVGLGMHNYESINGRLPVGAYGCCWGTWQVSILPYLEQQSNVRPVPHGAQVRRAGR